MRQMIVEVSKGKKLELYSSITFMNDVIHLALSYNFFHFIPFFFFLRAYPKTLTSLTQINLMGTKLIKGGGLD